jgi:hypothetical protein
MVALIDGSAADVSAAVALPERVLFIGNSHPSTAA